MKKQAVIAFDMGTGGGKTSLISADGQIVASSFQPYVTHYPSPAFHEQRPEEWWEALKASIKDILSQEKTKNYEVVAISTSGHSLGVIPIGKKANLLRDYVPIWSDRRADEIAQNIFDRVDEEAWYKETGNGFPPSLYAAFKMLWYKQNEPEMYEQVSTFLGTKDYINFRLSGVMCTDYSDASGSGLFDLKAWQYDPELIDTFGLDHEKLPEINSSDEILGEIIPEIALELGLPANVKVVCGGVDNSCMALGARGIQEGRVYTSLGSSAWIAVTSQTPVIDTEYRPYVFAHVLKGFYNSATCIFSAGSSLKWVKELFYGLENKEAYNEITALAEAAPAGANGISFNPSLAGASSLEKGKEIYGSFTGLKLSNGKGDIFRATFEGIALNLRVALDILEKYSTGLDQMLIVGGGAKNSFWMQLFAHIYRKEVVLSSINQEATSLGAAALAFVATGIWKDYTMIDQICQVKEVMKPLPEMEAFYQDLLMTFMKKQEELAEG